MTEANGQPWLDRNPLADAEVRSEPDVRRPVASHERFEATIVALRKRQENFAAEVQATTKKERDRAESRLHSWTRAELGRVLLETSGRRHGAIMGLPWEDVDFERRRSTWRAEFDKKSKASVVPYAESLFDAIREFQRRLDAIGGAVFARKKDPSRSAPAEHLSQWIAKAEDDAKLPKLKGGTCHPYRRKWRSERAHHPIKAVAVAGGWTDLETMFRSYDIPEDADVLAVTSESRKRREVAAATASSATA